MDDPDSPVGLRVVESLEGMLEDVVTAGGAAVVVGRFASVDCRSPRVIEVLPIS